jgi:2-phospho-L-lactate guanylyltransferase
MKPLAIIIPVKSPREGKSRLTGVLRADDRYELNSRLLTHTLDQVAHMIDIAEAYVVSKSPAVLAEAARRGFTACPESDPCELNGAVSLGAKQAGARGATQIMVLPIDLPWLSSSRLRHLVDEFRADYDAMIIADRAGDGTNVLLWRPIETAIFKYGVGSAARHADVAQNLGYRVDIRQDRYLSFDLDTPQDLKIWSRSEAGNAAIDATVKLGAERTRDAALRRRNRRNLGDRLALLRRRLKLSGQENPAIDPGAKPP